MLIFNLLNMDDSEAERALAEPALRWRAAQTTLPRSAMRPDLRRTAGGVYRTVVCRDLRTDAGGDLYDAPAALLMHGTEADPVFC